MTLHTFHIPVLVLGYSVDSPIKGSTVGIRWLASSVDYVMIERMRHYHTLQEGEAYVPIQPDEDDFPSRRITSYVNLMNRIIDHKFNDLQTQPFETGTDTTRYFE